MDQTGGEGIISRGGVEHHPSAASSSSKQQRAAASINDWLSVCNQLTRRNVASPRRTKLLSAVDCCGLAD